MSSFLELRMMEMVVTTGYKMCRAPIKHRDLPVVQPTVSKHWRKRQTYKHQSLTKSVIHINMLSYHNRYKYDFRIQLHKPFWNKNALAPPGGCRENCKNSKCSHHCSMRRAYQEILERIWPNVIFDDLSDLVSTVVSTVTINEPPEERFGLVDLFLATSCCTGWRN